MHNIQKAQLFNQLKHSGNVEIPAIGGYTNVTSKPEH
jgi:hypothetical protein